MRGCLVIAMLAATVMSAAEARAVCVSSDATWSGVMKVDGMLHVEKGATLTITPGTTVVFVKGRPNDEGIAQGGMVVTGRIVAKGTPDKRIRFTSAEYRPRAGDWGEIQLIESEGSVFENCEFEFAGWGLHVHDSRVLVKGCTFSRNSFGGLRGKGGEVEVAGCTFTGMDIGIRYWQGAPRITGNEITGNNTGIFCRQSCEGSEITGNNLYGNAEYDLKLGDGHAADVDAAGNWWGTTDVAEIRRKIFDNAREGYIGHALIEPVLTERVER